MATTEGEAVTVDHEHNFVYDYALDNEVCSECGSFRPPVVDYETYYTNRDIDEEIWRPPPPEGGE